MTEPERRQKREDPYWWTPWAVLVGLVTYGLLGYLGMLSPPRDGPTAADVGSAPPAPQTPSATATATAK